MCRCLGGCSHAMSNNEERAWEEWETKPHDLVGDPRRLNARWSQAIEAPATRPGHHRGRSIDGRGSARSVPLRHGPERPE
jgi:hypothetical protein